MLTYRIEKGVSIYPKALAAKILNENGDEVYTITHCGNESTSMNELYARLKARAEEYIEENK